MACGSIRDSEINTAYTAGGNTAYDKLKITVVGASFTPFWHCRAVLGRKGPIIYGFLTNLARFEPQ